MKKIDEIKKFLKNSNNIVTLFKERIPKWQKDKGYYDKIGWGFNLDERFKAHQGTSIRFDSWKGVYGDSGCSRELSLDDDVFNKHLIRYMNLHKESIMLGVADLIKEEAAKLEEEARKEIEKDVAMLDSLKSL